MLDKDEAISLLHNAPITHSYGYNGLIVLTEPSYVIPQADLVKLFNFVAEKWHREE